MHIYGEATILRGSLISSEGRHFENHPFFLSVRCFANTFSGFSLSLSHSLLLEEKECVSTLLLPVVGVTFLSLGFHDEVTTFEDRSSISRTIARDFYISLTLDLIFSLSHCLFLFLSSCLRVCLLCTRI